MAKSEQRKEYERQRRAKVCDDCGGPKEIAGYCVSCWDKRKKRNKVLRDKKISIGECITCTNKVINSDRSRCDICLEKTKNRRIIREAEKRNFGICIYCDNKANPKNGFCEVCYCKRTSKFHFGNSKMHEGLKDLFDKQKGLCPYTGRLMTLGENTSLDHIIPKSKGGKNDLDNLQWVFSCENFDINTMKWNMTEEEFGKIILEIASFMSINHI